MQTADLTATPLFQDIAVEELAPLLSCLRAVERRYTTGETVFASGQPADRVGIVREGHIAVLREDVAGNRTIVTTLGPGDLFGETFACARGADRVLPVTVQAETACVILLIDYRRIVTVCPSACTYHTRLVENMLAILADKNLLLNRRLGHLSQRTTRAKVLSYLSEEAARQGSRAITIPFDRQGLADYLCVERSALSAVLGTLRKEGILTVARNRFVLHDE